jgi:hypothetical protein
MRVVIALAALALLIVPAGRSEPPPPQAVCTALPAKLLGNYFRYDDRSWELTFDSDCTYKAVHRSIEEGGGNYVLSEGDESSGSFVISNDQGCQQPDLEDLPTPYEYSFSRGLLALGPVGGISADRCANTKGEGRAHELAGHGGWVKAVAGKVSITINGRSFKISGVLEDRGSVKITKRGTRRTLRFTGGNGTFTATERLKKGKVTWSLTGAGSGGYRNLSGVGSGTARGSRQSLHGSVSN